MKMQSLVLLVPSEGKQGYRKPSTELNMFYCMFGVCLFVCLFVFLILMLFPQTTLKMLSEDVIVFCLLDFPLQLQPHLTA